MDRRLTVIIAICLMEASFRSLYGYVQMDGLAYTLAVRLMQTAVIIIFSLNLCGIVPAKFGREVVIGLAVSCIFAVLIFLTDLASRLVFERGLLSLLLAKQPVTRPLLFFLTGCLIGPFAEELFFRGLLYSWVRPRLGTVLSIVLTSLFFASMHGQLSSVQLVGGIIFASLFEWRKNIWAPFTVHLLGNMGIWIIPYIYPLK